MDDVTNALRKATDRLISGKYMTAGVGDGGGCHPRDNIALSWLARNLNISFDIYDSLMKAREKHEEWFAGMIIKEKQKNPNLDVVILGKAFKPETNLIVGSPALLLKNILLEKKIEPIMYDPYVDKEFTYNQNKPHIFFVSTRHKDFQSYNFAPGSIVLDPWRFIQNKEGIKVIRIGENK